MIKATITRKENHETIIIQNMQYILITHQMILIIGHNYETIDSLIPKEHPQTRNYHLHSPYQWHPHTA